MLNPTSTKAIDLLVVQHRRTKEVLVARERGTSDLETATRLLQTLGDGLTAHLIIEGTVFYPAVRAKNAAPVVGNGKKKAA